VPSSPSRRVGLLVNPSAGRGRGAAHGRRARARLVADGHDVQDVSGAGLEDARALAAAAIASGAIDVLCVVGGDGVVHLGVNLCAGTDVPLAVVAAGTGNDNARALGLPVHRPESAAALVAEGHLRTIDAGRCVCADDSVRWWLGVLGGGFDSVVAERAARWTWPPGPLRYVLAVLRELPAFTAIPYAVTVDGVRHQTEAMLVAVANGPAFGGGMLVCPDAEYDDGLLDVLILHKVSVLELLRLLPKVFRGAHLSHPRVELVQGRRVRLEARGIITQADGERFEPLPIDVEIVPGALRVVAPRRASPLT